MVYILSRRGGGSQETRERVEESMSLDVSSRHSTGPENKRFCFVCFVFSDSCFSVEGSLPGTALPLETGVLAQGILRGFAT